MPGMQKQILDLLAQLWSMYPDERFGELLENHIFDGGELFFQEDESILKKLKEQLRNEFNID